MEDIDLKSMSFEEINENVQKNAEGLSAKFGCQVHGLLLNTGAGYYSQEGEWVIAYFKEPTLQQSLKIIDHMDEGDKSIQAMHLLKQNIIRENSDMKYFDEKDPKNKKVLIGAILKVCGKCLDWSIDQSTTLKKNTE